MEDSRVENLGSSVEDKQLLPAISETEAAEEAEDRNPVFQKLVTADDDVVGLVAYSIYKQNKLDWLRAFERRRGCVPGEAELAAYIIGESTPRRLATYRHLAESTLGGAAIGPKLAANRPNALPCYEPAPSDSAKTATVSYLILAVVVLIAIFLAARFGLVSK